MHPDAYIEMNALEEKHWWFQARREILKDQIIALDLKENANILEVGCGTGGNLKMLSAFGHTTAVEMNESARQIATDNNPFINKIYNGSLPNDISLNNEKYDLICLFDVLEHIREDQASLVKILDLLKPNGKIILTVPAYQWLWSNHDSFHHHHRRYSKKELKTLLEKSKMIPIKLSYFNSLLFPIAAVVRLFNKAKSHTNITKEKIPSHLINHLLSKVFLFERHILKHTILPFGLSLLVIAAANNSE